MAKNHLNKYTIPGIEYDNLTFHEFVNELHVNKLKHVHKYHFMFKRLKLINLNLIKILFYVVIQYRL